MDMQAVESGQKLVDRINLLPKLSKQDIAEIRRNFAFAKRNNSLAVKTSNQIREEAHQELKQERQNLAMPKILTAQGEQIANMTPINVATANFGQTSYEEYKPNPNLLTNHTKFLSKPSEENSPNRTQTQYLSPPLKDNEMNEAKETGNGSKWKEFELKHQVKTVA